MELLRLAQKAGVWRSRFYNLKEVKTQATLASVSRAMLPVNQTHAHRVDTAAARADIFENSMFHVLENLILQPAKYRKVI